MSREPPLTSAEVNLAEQMLLRQTMTDPKQPNALEARILNKLASALNPLILDVQNESHMHNVPPHSETHFKVVVVSETFQDEPLIKRHRRINQLLADELSGGVHALGLHTLTEPEWQKKKGQIPLSPKCLGGSAR